LVEALLDAPAGAAQRCLFHLADDPPLRVSDWAAMIARASGRPPPQRIPTPLATGCALCGDALAFLGWKTVPVGSSRLRNMRTPSPPVAVATTFEIA
jgi:hypothetical protein